MSRLQLSSTFAKKNKNVTISYVNSFLITMLIVYVNSPLLKAFFHQSRVIKSFFLYITFPNNRTQEIDFTKKSYETSQILVFNTLLPTKVRMLQSKSINKDVTNCYKVKITFFEKRITIFTFFSKTNLAYKVATEIGTLFFKTSDFQNKRRYLLVAQSVQVHIFCFSNSNFTRKKDFDKCQIYLYIPAIHWFRIEIFKYIGLFFFEIFFFFFWTTCSWNCTPFVQTADETLQDLGQPFRNQQFRKQASKEVAGLSGSYVRYICKLRVKTSCLLEVCQ